MEPSLGCSTRQKKARRRQMRVIQRGLDGVQGPRAGTSICLNSASQCAVLCTRIADTLL